MDKLTQLVVDYKESKDNLIIKDIQIILYPIISRLIEKWKFNSFPQLIRIDMIEEANTTILAAAIKLYDASKGAKFTSFYATRLNFLLRAEYMKYFQKGKPIQKRYGRLHELSMQYNYTINEDNVSGEKKTLEYLLADNKDIRVDIQSNFLHNAIKLLSPTEQKLIKSLYFNKTSKKEIIKNFDLSYQTIGKAKQKVLTKLRGLL